MDTDILRGLIMATIQSIFPVLQVAGLVDLTGDQLALIMAFVGNLTLLGAYIFKNGQSAAVGGVTGRG